MKHFLISLVCLAGGFGAGYYVGYRVSKKKHLEANLNTVNAAIEAVQKRYSKQEETDKDADKEAKQDDKKLPVIDNDSINYSMLKKQDKESYLQYVNAYSGKDIKPAVKEEKPVETESPMAYVLSPEEYSDSDYDVQTLIYYADGTLADEDFNVIKDIRGHVGDEALSSFGTFGIDHVYVRNEKYKIDYEILQDERKFSDVAPRGVPATPFPGYDDEQ